VEPGEQKVGWAKTPLLPVKKGVAEEAEEENAGSSADTEEFKKSLVGEVKGMGGAIA